MLLGSLVLLVLTSSCMEIGMDPNGIVLSKHNSIRVHSDFHTLRRLRFTNYTLLRH